MKCVEEIGYGSSFSFKYSVRPGTPGAGLPRQVPEDVKQSRLVRLQELLYTQQHDRWAGKLDRANRQSQNDGCRAKLFNRGLG